MTIKSRLVPDILPECFAKNVLSISSIHYDSFSRKQHLFMTSETVSTIYFLYFTVRLFFLVPKKNQ